MVNCALKYEEIVETVYINSVDEFYKNIVYNKELPHYIYRGHSKSDSYKLQPGLLRNLQDTSKKRREFYINELRALILFYTEANKHGLYVPKVDSFFQHGLANHFDVSLMLKDTEWKWLSDDLIELTSLAQHYGMKTRLLDWTQNIRVALYFACSDNIKNEEDMAIWCIDAMYLGDWNNDSITDISLANVLSYKGNGDRAEKYALIRALKDTNLPIRFFLPRYYKNDNIAAQRGVLSMWQYNLACKEIYRNSDKRNDIAELPRSDTIPTDIEKLRNSISEHMDAFLEADIVRDTEPLDKLLLDYFDQCKNRREKIRARQYKILYKYVLKKDLKDEFLSRLKADGYDEASIFPGYESIVKVVNNELSL
ncbi:FRG domain-containing protein [Veillonellaceae bacterium WCA-693-APC-5D-A]|uniref:FRG domain-containing protein n=1 Tax=Anaerovibrio slackiae TaxID=2652309 RepID=A0A6I2UDN5_9FIRM|nr:FRG domain-containing protein [Anaerovibrio slackiae]MSU07784.1 FRG domain-containing protein [Anaerovibrio slackiae]